MVGGEAREVSRWHGPRLHLPRQPGRLDLCRGIDPGPGAGCGRRAAGPQLQNGEDRGRYGAQRRLAEPAGGGGTAGRVQPARSVQDRHFAIKARGSAACSTRFTALLGASLLSGASLLLTALVTWVSEPLVRGRFVGKAPHIQAVLSRNQFDVLVRKPQLRGIPQQRDAPRRCGRKLAQVLDQPVPLELKYRLRRADRDQDARGPALLACADDRLEKGFRFLNRLAAE